MKMQEIFNEYIELLPYMVENKKVFTTITLYNSYIKPTFAKKEVSILLLTDYQEFANNLLLPFPKTENTLSIDCINEIMNVLVSIVRYGIKSNYGVTENLALEVKLFENSKSESFNDDLKEIVKDIEFKS